MKKQSLKKDIEPDVIEISYQLNESPSCQHRAGLAGLVLMVQQMSKQTWIEQRQGYIAELIGLEKSGVNLKINFEGVKSLLDFAYESFKEERSTQTKIKDYDYFLIKN